MLVVCTTATDWGGQRESIHVINVSFKQKKFQIRLTKLKWTHKMFFFFQRENFGLHLTEWKSEEKRVDA